MASALKWGSLTLPRSHLISTLASRRISCCKGRLKMEGTVLPSLSSENAKIGENQGSGSFETAQKGILVGCGAVSVDYVASVASFPNPDDKIRSTDFKIQGGGNVGNALTASARLGITCRIISKVADDNNGRFILDELKGDGVDTSHIVVSETGTSPFTYIIVDREMNTRTCIHTPGSPPMVPTDLLQASLDKALSGAKLVFFDGRLPTTAIAVAKEAVQRGIPILIDAERPREGLDELLDVADYLVCSSKFPQTWTQASALPEALLSIASHLPRLKFVIVTLGADGCAMLERVNPVFADSDGNVEKMDVNSTYESLVKETQSSDKPRPFVVSSKIGLLEGKSVKDSNTRVEICGRIIVGTAEQIKPSEVVDTTGAGDAFIGSVLYGLCTGMAIEKILVLGAVVAGANCGALGARGGMPRRGDARVLALL